MVRSGTTRYLNVMLIYFTKIKIRCFFISEEYSQEIPANRPWEKPSGPPILPPHLLQVILNKDTPLSVSPVPSYTLCLLENCSPYPMQQWNIFIFV